MRHLGSAALALFIVMLASGAQALPMVFVASLDGPSESPPIVSPGTGSVQVDFDIAAHTMRVQVTFSGLLGTTTAAHIHCCVAAPGTVGVATTTPTFAGFPLGVTGGSYDQILDMTLASSFNPAFVVTAGSVAQAEATLFAGMAAGLTYFNIHTTLAPGGEIRGFLRLASVPEPTSLGLFGLGLAGLVLMRRRR